MKFHETVSLKEMLERARGEGATEIKRILPVQNGLIDLELGFRRGKECKNLSMKN